MEKDIDPQTKDDFFLSLSLHKQKRKTQIGCKYKFDGE